MSMALYNNLCSALLLSRPGFSCHIEYSILARVRLKRGTLGKCL